MKSIITLPLICLLAWLRCLYCQNLNAVEIFILADNQPMVAENCPILKFMDAGYAMRMYYNIPPADSCKMGSNSVCQIFTALKILNDTETPWGLFIDCNTLVHEDSLNDFIDSEDSNFENHPIAKVFGDFAISDNKMLFPFISAGLAFNKLSITQLHNSWNTLDPEFFSYCSSSSSSLTSSCQLSLLLSHFKIQPIDHSSFSQVPLYLESPFSDCGRDAAWRVEPHPFHQDSVPSIGSIFINNTQHDVYHIFSSKTIHPFVSIYMKDAFHQLSLSDNKLSSTTTTQQQEGRNIVHDMIHGSNVLRLVRNIDNSGLDDNTHIPMFVLSRNPISPIFRLCINTARADTRKFNTFTTLSSSSQLVDLYAYQLYEIWGTIDGYWNLNHHHHQEEELLCERHVDVDLFSIVSTALRIAPLSPDILVPSSLTSSSEASIRLSLCESIPVIISTATTTANYIWQVTNQPNPTDSDVDVIELPMSDKQLLSMCSRSDMHLPNLSPTIQPDIINFCNALLAVMDAHRDSLRHYDRPLLLTQLPSDNLNAYTLPDNHTRSISPLYKTFLSMNYGDDLMWRWQRFVSSSFPLVSQMKHVLMRSVPLEATFEVGPLADMLAAGLVSDSDDDDTMSITTATTDELNSHNIHNTHIQAMLQKREISKANLINTVKSLLFDYPANYKPYHVMDFGNTSRFQSMTHRIRHMITSPEQVNEMKETLIASLHQIGYPKYKLFQQEPSDVSELMHILKELASRCRYHVTELGVRRAVSTWAIAVGLAEGRVRLLSRSSNNNNNDAKIPIISMLGVDIEYHETIENVRLYAEYLGIDYAFLLGSDLITPIVDTEFLFIDTWHVYGHLKYELSRYGPHVLRYIALHDTTGDEYRSEALRLSMSSIEDLHEQSLYERNWIRAGLWPAVIEFLVESKGEWVLANRYSNCNGLTVLQRSSCTDC